MLLRRSPQNPCYVGILAGEDGLRPTAPSALGFYVTNMLALPSMAAELQGRASPAVTACWPRTTADRSSRYACGTRVAEDSNRANRTAAACAFSLTSRITQRDGTIGRDAPGSRTLLYPGDPGPHRPAPPRRSRACGRLPEPGLLDDSGLASASRPRIARGPQAPGRQPGHPGARSSSPAASGRPGRASVHPPAP